MKTDPLLPTISQPAALPVHRCLKGSMGIVRRQKQGVGAQSKAINTADHSMMCTRSFLPAPQNTEGLSVEALHVVVKTELLEGQG